MNLDYPENPPMCDITLEQLSIFEDLYYASVAKFKQLVQVVDLLLDNNFKTEEDPYFTYGGPPLDQLGPILLGEFKAFLETQNAVLADEAFVSLFEKAVMRKSMQETTGNLSSQPIGTNRLDWMMTSRKLLDVHNMSSGMIFGHLAEKHRGQESQQPHQSSTFLTNEHEPLQTPSGADLATDGSEPNNMNPHVETQSTTGLAEFPCICDPDCICYHLCASDTTQNCLCEENALFTNVTEGANIDELDVPDLVRPTTIRYPDNVRQDDERSDDELSDEGFGGDDDDMSEGEVSAISLNLPVIDNAASAQSSPGFAADFAELEAAVGAPTDMPPPKGHQTAEKFNYYSKYIDSSGPEPATENEYGDLLSSVETRDLAHSHQDPYKVSFTYGCTTIIDDAYDAAAGPEDEDSEYLTYDAATILPSFSDKRSSFAKIIFPRQKIAIRKGYTMETDGRMVIKPIFELHKRKRKLSDISFTAGIKRFRSRR